MTEIILKGKSASPGKVKGKALVSNEMIAFGGTPNLKTGVIEEPNHCLLGKNVRNKILVYPTGKGSTGDPYSCYFLMKYGNAPAAVINKTANPTTVASVLLSNIPMVYDLDKDPLTLIESGDEVEVDADNGIVKVFKERR